MKKYYLLITLLVLFSSCKDTDGDKIYDKDDKCPNTFGLVEFNGCPDTDGDGIIDSEDDCPEDYGLEEFDGCPDTDEDGIPDHEDECPDTYGYARFDGCPNNDHVQLLVSDCLRPYSFTSNEINKLLADTGYTLNSEINLGMCNLLIDRMIDKRKYEEEMRRFEEEKRRLDAGKRRVDGMGKELNEGYIQATYIQGNSAQYVVILKGGVKGRHYLMQVISGGKCPIGGTTKFDETTYGIQQMWVRDEPFKIKATLFTMKLLDSSKSPFDLEKLFN